MSHATSIQSSCSSCRILYYEVPRIWAWKGLENGASIMRGRERPWSFKYKRLQFTSCPLCINNYLSNPASKSTRVHTLYRKHSLQALAYKWDIYLGYPVLHMEKALIFTARICGLSESAGLRFVLSASSERPKSIWTTAAPESSFSLVP